MSFPGLNNISAQEWTIAMAEAEAELEAEKNPANINYLDVFPEFPSFSSFQETRDKEEDTKGQLKDLLDEGEQLKYEMEQLIQNLRKERKNALSDIFKRVFGPILFSLGFLHGVAIAVGRLCYYIAILVFAYAVLPLSLIASMILLSKYRSVESLLSVFLG